MKWIDEYLEKKKVNAGLSRNNIKKKILYKIKIHFRMKFDLSQNIRPQFWLSNLHVNKINVKISKIHAPILKFLSKYHYQEIDLVLFQSIETISPSIITCSVSTNCGNHLRPILLVFRPHLIVRGNFHQISHFSQ